jgi:antitoxin HicB
LSEAKPNNLDIAVGFRSSTQPTTRNRARGTITLNSRYTIVIQWSNEDDCFVVSLPEWGEFCHTHGNSYEEALKNAREVLELLIDSCLEDGKPLPEPQIFGKVLLAA